MNTENRIEEAISSPSRGYEGELIWKMVGEVNAMAAYATGSGLAIQPSTMKRLQVILAKIDNDEKIDIEIIMGIHREFVDLIAPATPRSVFWQADGANNSIGADNPAKFIWVMIALTLACLALFMALTTLDLINKEVLSQDFMSRSGKNQFLVATFYLAAAGIGACFFNLFKIYRHMTKGTYNPKYMQTYWIRFVIGIVAGYLLAEVIALDMQETSIGKPLLAMLGGFSADAVEWLLIRFVDILRVSIKGSETSITENVEADAKLRINAHARELRTDFTQSLQELYEVVPEGADRIRLKEKLDDIRNRYL